MLENLDVGWEESRSRVVRDAAGVCRPVLHPGHLLLLPPQEGQPDGLLQQPETDQTGDPYCSHFLCPLDSSSHPQSDGYFCHFDQISQTGHL